MLSALVNDSQGVWRNSKDRTKDPFWENQGDAAGGHEVYQILMKQEHLDSITKFAKIALLL